jgi:hypothetical protein
LLSQSNSELEKRKTANVSSMTDPKASPQEHRRPRFSFCLHLSKSGTSGTTFAVARSDSGWGNRFSREAQSRRRRVALPSVWSGYSRGWVEVSTPIFDLFCRMCIFVPAVSLSQIEEHGIRSFQRLDLA